MDRGMYLISRNLVRPQLFLEGGELGARIARNPSVRKYRRVHRLRTASRNGRKLLVVDECLRPQRVYQ